MTRVITRIIPALAVVLLALSIRSAVVAHPVTRASATDALYRSYVSVVLSSAIPQAAVAQPTLLSSYVIWPYPEYQAARYTPRGMTAALYAGWDILSLPGKTVNDGVNTTMSNADWLTLTLNRPAELAIVWRGTLAPPEWLQGWTPAADVTIDGQSYPTYRKSAAAGTLLLGGVNNPGDTTSQPTYLVLFAESGGAPSPAPTIPAGKETPQPNAPCLSWVHDQYVTVGPDGKTYPTWHPQIDPVYWCYFGHEHGSDPALTGSSYKPAYGYSAAAAAQDEAHPGFKTYVFDDMVGHWWVITHHFGTASLKRACTRFHTVDIAVIDRATGERLTDFHQVGDFGQSVANKTGEALTPSACPDQASAPAAEGSNGIRMLPVETRDSIGYEPWRMDNSSNVLGLTVAGLTFNTPDAVVICNDIACDQPVATGSSGAFHFFTFTSGFGIKAGANSGTFYSDARAKQVLSGSVPGAVQQFVKPGVDIAVPSHPDNQGFYATDTWHELYICSPEPSIASNFNLEGALKSPN
jgi:hypothetical protein